MVWQTEVGLIPAIVKQQIHLLLEYVRGSKDDKSPKAQSVEVALLVPAQLTNETARVIAYRGVSLGGQSWRLLLDPTW